MDISAFRIYYVYKEVLYSAEIRPCCREDNVLDYAVWNDDQLSFTIARHKETNEWVIALKNADDDIEDELVQLIGAEIDKKINAENL